MSKKIIITGANGQLGRELQAAVHRYPDWEAVFLSRDDLPIDDEAAVEHFFNNQKAAYCINCAAYTAVDKAESEREQAYRINADAAGWMARVCNGNNTRFIHISTDYVFDGLSSTPLTEEHPTAPVNTYGASKLKGEELVLQHDPLAIIIRTSWVYSSFGNNFVKTMIRLMQERPTINVVNDQQGSPTYAADLADAILQIINSGRWIPGIFNYSNEGNITWFEFAQSIKAFIHSSCEVLPIPSTGFPTPAKRPAYSLLDKKKIREVYGIAIPDWQTSLAKCISKIFA